LIVTIRSLDEITTSETPWKAGGLRLLAHRKPRDGVPGTDNCALSSSLLPEHESRVDSGNDAITAWEYPMTSSDPRPRYSHQTGGTPAHGELADLGTPGERLP